MTVLDKMKEEKAKNEEKKLKELKKRGVKFMFNGNEFELYFIEEGTFKINVNGIAQPDLFTRSDAESAIKDIFDGKYPREVSNEPN